MKNLLDERLRESGYIRMDETPAQVLRSDQRAARLATLTCCLVPDVAPSEEVSGGAA